MAQLGLKLEQQLAQLDAGEGLSAELAARWGAEETARERSQWRPVRSVQLAEEQAGTATARVVDIEDVEDFLVDLGTVCSPACLMCHSCLQQCLMKLTAHPSRRSVHRGPSNQLWSYPIAVSASSRALCPTDMDGH